ncbi:MAG: PKD domain-containing protein [Elusimicrobiota bacterium]
MAAAVWGHQRVLYWVRPANSAPVADAGPDLNVQQWAVASVDGTGTSDVDGEPLTFDWTLLSKPAGSAVTGLYQDLPATPCTDNTSCADGHLYGYPEQPKQYGGGSNDSHVHVGRYSWGSYRGFAGFDVSELPAGVQVQSAVMRLFFDAGADESITGPIIVDLVDWKDKLYAPVDANEPLMSGIGTLPAGLPNGAQWKSLDVSAAVRHAFGLGKTPQFRLRMTNESASSTGYARFRSRDYSEEYSPRLEIALSPPGNKAQFIPDVPGDYTIQLTVSDGRLDSSDTAVVSASPNARPTADDQSVSLRINIPRAITLTGADLEGADLTFIMVAQPSRGTLTGTIPNLTYTPDTDYTGQDSFTFKVNDGAAESAVATVSILVRPLEPAPEFLFHIPEHVSKLSYPHDVTVAPSGNYYIVDRDYKIVEIDSDGNTVRSFGEGNNDRRGIAVDSAGNIYVTDRGDERVRKFSPTGALLAWWGNSGTADGLFRDPIGIALDSEDNVYVADVANHRIQKFVLANPCPAGTTAVRTGVCFVAKWGGGSSGYRAGSADGEFSSPSDVVIDASGNAYVADGGNNRIQRLDSDGNFIAKWTATAGRVDVDAMGMVYALDSGNNRVRKYDSVGHLLAEWGELGAGEGQFDYPAAMAVNDSGFVAVLDSGWPKTSLSKFTSEGAFLWEALGSGGAIGSIRTLAADAAGNVYVNKYSGNSSIGYRIAKFNAEGDFLKEWDSGGVNCIGVSPSGKVYVTGDAQNIKRYDSEGNDLGVIAGIAGSAPGQFNGLVGVAPDAADQYIYVADAGNRRVQKLTVDGTYVTHWGSAGSGDGQFNGMEDIGVDAAGNVYTLESHQGGGGNRVQKFDSDGNFITKWGSFSGSFSYPIGIGVDPSGNVYVSEINGRRVQKFSSSGEFLTTWNRDFGNLYDVAADGNGRVYVADNGNQRIDVFGPFASPTADNQSVTTPERTPVSITLTGTSGGSGGMGFEIVAEPANGALAGTAPSLTYTPDAGFFGFDHVLFRTVEGGLSSPVAYAAVRVEPVNDPPSFDEIADQAVAKCDSDCPEETITVAGISAGPNEFEPVSMSAVSSDSGIVPDPAITGTDGFRTLTYQPAAGRSGTVTITVTADDGQPEDNIFSRTFAITVYEQAPGTPTGFQITGLSATSLDVRWDTSPGAETYTIEASPSAGFSSGVISYVTAVNHLAAAGLTPSTLYHVRVKASNDQGSSGFSSAASAHTPPVVPARLYSFEIGQDAQAVLGQADANSNVEFGPSQTSLRYPAGVALDASGNLWVSEIDHHRVLMFEPPLDGLRPASLVLGQGDFTSGSWPTTAQDTLKQPHGLAVDASGNLWVADYRNHRVVRFSPPFTTGMTADLVLGQANFTDPGSGAGRNRMRYPTGVSFDATGNLFVADTENHRVLMFSPPFQNGMDATAILGQTGSPGTAANTLNLPQDVEADGLGNVWVADTENFRVLRFTPPFQDGMSADLVLGNPDFVTRDYGTSQTSMRYPNGLAVDPAGNVYVSNMYYHLIAIFAPPFSNGMPSTSVLGQETFTGSGSGLGPDRLYYPRGLAFHKGSLWAADNGNKRVISFAGAPGSFSGFDTNALAVSWSPAGNPAGAQYSAQLSADPGFGGTPMESGLVASTGHRFTGLQQETVYYARVKARNQPGAETAYVELGGARTLTPNTAPVADAGADQTVDQGELAVVDAAGSGDADGDVLAYFWEFVSKPAGSDPVIHHRAGETAAAFLADAIGSYTVRVTVSDDRVGGTVQDTVDVTVVAPPALTDGVFQNGADAEVVLLQPDFDTYGNITSRPEKVLFDGSGDLWLTDSGMNRVVRFEQPFSIGDEPTLVLGQENFEDSHYGYGEPDEFWGPNGTWFDSTGRLWVIDQGNHRLLRFTPPFSNGMDAELVIGQPDFKARTAGAGAGQVNAPWDLTLDADGRLWLADTYNNRVLRFSPPFENGMSADLVIGQTDFGLNGDGIAADKLHGPSAVAVGPSGNLWVAEWRNNRVLRFSPPFASGMSADMVIGQTDFTSNTGAATASKLGDPRDLAFSQDGSLWTIASGNARILEFKPPFSTGMEASTVEGQVDFTTTPAWWTGNSHMWMDQPHGIAFDRLGNMAAAVWGHQRVLYWVRPANSAPVADAGPSQTVNVGDLVTLSGTASDEDPEDTLSYGWTVTDSAGDPVSVDDPETLTPSFTPAKADTYTAELTAGDEQEEGSDTTLIHAMGTFESAGQVNGNPELSLAAALEVTLSTVDTSTEGAYLLAAGYDQDLFPVGNIYDVGPEGPLDPPGTLTICYDPQVLADNGIAAGDVSLNHYVEPGWEALSATLNEENGCLSAELTEIASIFGLFAADGTSPELAASVEGGELQNIKSPRFTLTYGDTGSGADPATLAAGLDGGPRDYFVLAESEGSMTLLFGSGEDGLRIEGEPTPETTYEMADGEHSAAFEMADRTGNKGAASAGFRVDTTPPVITASSSAATGQDGWSNADVEVSFECSDEGSGLAEGACPEAATVEGEGADLSASGEVTDLAGNSASATLGAIKIDRTAPAITASRSAATGQDGWSNADVEVSFECSDEDSGLAEGACPEAATVEGEGADLSASGEVTDLAGNSASATLGAIKIDRTAPTITASRSAATGQEGWSNADVAVSFECSDDGSGLAEDACPAAAAVEGEGADLRASGEVTDLAGNSASATLGGIKIDRTMPTFEYAAQVPVANGAGWNNADVSFAFTADDGLSGVASTSIESPLVLSDEGGAVIGEVTVTDAAGNSAAFAPPAVKIDKTAPTLEYAAQVPVANGAGWNNTDVSFSFTADDALSGVASTSIESPLVLSDEGAAVTGDVTVTDAAGNSATFASPAVKIDKTDPGLSFAAQGPAANGAGWNSTDVAFAFTADDALSGVASTSVESPLVLSEEGAAVAGGVTVADAAGNSATFTSTAVKIDKTAPTLEYAAQVPVANGAGWNNTDVSFSFAAGDALSGVASTSIESPLVLSEEGAAVAGDVTVTDAAGNSATFASPAVKIDKTDPGLSFAAQSPAANGAGWNNTDVAFAFTADDALSGVASTSVESPLVLSEEGAAVTGDVTVADAAGNSATFTSIAVKIDKTAPTLEYAAQVPVANGAGWNNADVSFAFTADDSLSGLASTSIVSPLMLSDEGEAVSGEVTATDAAGNSAVFTSPAVNIDKSDPQVAISKPSGGQYVATRDPIVIDFSVADLDPDPAITGTLTLLHAGSGASGKNGGPIAVNDGDVIPDPLALTAGTWQLSVAATDRADNSNSAIGVSFEVIHDIRPPRTSVAVAEPRYPDASEPEPALIYVTGATTLTASSIDDLVDVGDEDGLGVGLQAVKVGGSQRFSWENPSPAIGESFENGFTLDDADGAQLSLVAEAEDTLGNPETGEAMSLRIDNKAPIVSHEFSAAPVVRPPKNEEWFAADFQIVWSAEDGTGSGVASLDGPTDAILEGAVELYTGRAADNVGNEGSLTVAVNLDKTAPVVDAGSDVTVAEGAELGFSASVSDNLDERVVFGWTFGDGGTAGQDLTPSHAYADNGVYEAIVSATDHAGHGASDPLTVTVLNEPPVVTAGGEQVAGANGLLRIGGMIAVRRMDAWGDGGLISLPIGPDAPIVVPAITSSDLGALDTHTATIDWGEPPPAEPEDVPVDAGTISAEHHYAASGVYTLLATVTDNDGGSGSDGFQVKADVEAPETVLSHSGDVSTDGGGPAEAAVFLGQDAMNALSATDAVVEDISGVQWTFRRDLTIDGTNSTFTLHTAAFSLAEEGPHRLEYFSVDMRGNEEGRKSITIGVDHTASSCALDVGNPVKYEFDQAYISPNTELTLTAFDIESAGVASGVKDIRYRIDDGAEVLYQAPFTLQEGVRTVTYWSVDKVNNVEVEESMLFNVGKIMDRSATAGAGKKKSIVLLGTVDLTGDLASNGPMTLKGSVVVDGNVIAPTITLNKNSTITGSQTEEEDPLNPAPFDLVAVKAYVEQHNLAEDPENPIAAFLNSKGDLVMNGQASLSLPAGDYLLAGIKLSGGAELTIEGKVGILVEGPIDINASSVNAGAETPDSLTIFNNQETDIDLKGHARLAALVYAPDATTNFSGSAQYGGRPFTGHLTMSGSGIALSDTAPEAYAAEPSEETGKGGKAASAGPAAEGADPTFALRDVYVFPNPAVDGARPVIHAAVGIADKVTLRVYNVAGQQVHQATLEGAPPVIDDGSGPKYAYEYVWDGRIPSGVYLYTIVAEKSGEASIRKAGKFAVVR